FLLYLHDPLSFFSPLSLHDALPIYSIWPFTERKSSSAQAAMASYSLGERRKGTCFFSMSIQTSRIYDGLGVVIAAQDDEKVGYQDRKSTRLNSSHVSISYAVFCLKK